MTDEVPPSTAVIGYSDLEKGKKYTVSGTTLLDNGKGPTATITCRRDDAPLTGTGATVVLEIEFEEGSSTLTVAEQSLKTDPKLISGPFNTAAQSDVTSGGLRKRVVVSSA